MIAHVIILRHGMEHLLNGWFPLRQQAGAIRELPLQSGLLVCPSWLQRRFANRPYT